MTQEHLIMSLDKWPDFAEVYQQGDDESTRRLQFVVVRRNSRPLQPELMQLLQMVELAGLTVKVRVGTVDLTIEQFEQGGVFKARPTISSESSQSFYNARSTLKRLEALIEGVDKDDPRYYTYARKIQHYRQMLETVEPEPAREALQTSDERLKELERIFASEPAITASKGFWEMTDEEVATLTFQDLEKLGIEKLTSAWEKVVTHWGRCRNRPKGEDTNATQQPNTAGQDNDHKQTREGRDQPDIVVD
jgi:hypothetical protein